MAFASYTNNLVEVTIPNTVTTLGREPVNVNEGFGPFRNCTLLQTVIFQENSQLTFIGITTFYLCSSLTMISIPPTVTHIDFQALSNTGLTSITIPASVDFVNFFVFYQCFNLSFVIFEGISQLDYGGLNSRQIFSECFSLQEIYCTPDTLTNWNITAGPNQELSGSPSLTIFDSLSEPNIIVQLGKYYIWNQHTNSKTSQAEIAKWSNSGYNELNSVPLAGATTFDGYNILSDMIQPINDYINNSMPDLQKKTTASYFFTESINIHMYILIVLVVGHPEQYMLRISRVYLIGLQKLKIRLTRTYFMF